MLISLILIFHQIYHLKILKLKKLKAVLVTNPLKSGTLFSAFLIFVFKVVSVTHPLATGISFSISHIFYLNPI